MGKNYNVTYVLDNKGDISAGPSVNYRRILDDDDIKVFILYGLERILSGMVSLEKEPPKEVEFYINIKED